LGCHDLRRSPLFLLTPSVLVRLPPSGSKYTVAAFHGLVFALVFHFTHKTVWQLSLGLSAPSPLRKKEGMENEKDEEKKEQ